MGQNTNHSFTEAKLVLRHDGCRISKKFLDRNFEDLLMSQDFTDNHWVSTLSSSMQSYCIYQFILTD